MLACVRTTIRLDDDLLVDAKRRAAEEGKTLTAVIEDALRQSLAARPEPPSLPRYEVEPFGGEGTLPGVDIYDNASLRDLMDGLAG
jgi:hypothetical protein